MIGWAFAAVGTVAVWRAPENRTGPLLAAFGLVVELSALISSDTPFLYALATLADPLAIAVFAHLLVAFPDGRLPGRVARGVIVALLRRRRGWRAGGRAVRPRPRRPRLRRLPAQRRS